MTQITLTSFMNGGQLRNLFKAYNKAAGSKIIDMSLSYNKGDKYANKISDGGQINLAFKAINDHLGRKELHTEHEDWSNIGKLAKDLQVIAGHAGVTLTIAKSESTTDTITFTPPSPPPPSDTDIITHP